MNSFIAAPVRRATSSHLWICPFLCRYSRPSSTSLNTVAMLASSRTPVLCSPLEMICLITSSTEPAKQRWDGGRSFHTLCATWENIAVHHFEMFQSWTDDPMRKSPPDSVCQLASVLWTRTHYENTYFLVAWLTFSQDPLCRIWDYYY